MAEKKEAKTKAPKKPSRSQLFHSGITEIYNIASDRAGVAVRHLLESHGDAILEAFEASIMKVVEDLVRSRIADLRKQVEEAESSLAGNQGANTGDEASDTFTFDAAAPPVTHT